MHLDTYLKEIEESQADFGLTLSPPVSQAQVSQWCRGVTRITLNYALQIEDISGGKVSPQDCADMYVEPQLRLSHCKARQGQESHGD